MLEFGKLIGKGAFSKVYSNPLDPTTCLIKTNDKAKEALALFPPSSECPIFPKLEIVEEKDDSCNIIQNDYSVYKAKYYTDAKSRSVLPKLKKKHKTLYRALRRMPLPSIQHKNFYSFWFDAFEGLPSELADEKLALQDYLGSCANWGDDVTFEISPRNVATENGNLILLDCFFFVHDLLGKRG